MNERSKDLLLESYNAPKKFQIYIFGYLTHSISNHALNLSSSSESAKSNKHIFP